MTEDGKCEIKLTEEQKCWWIDSAKKSIQRVLDEANQLDGCIFEVNDNFTDLNVQIRKGITRLFLYSSYTGYLLRGNNTAIFRRR